MSELGPIARLRRSGVERFHHGREAQGFDLLSFWQWSASDLVSDTLRGVLAEYLVAQAMGVANTGIREKWASFDIRTPQGITFEVKSAAYVQSWHQERLSPIVFSCPKSGPRMGRQDSQKMSLGASPRCMCSPS
jgi:hypothetical protein